MKTGVISSIDECAAQWLARRNAGLSEQDEREFQAWLVADPAHRARFQNLEEVWRTISFDGQPRRARDASTQLTRRSVQRAARRRRIVWGGAYSLVAAILTLVWMPRSENVDSSVAQATVSLRPDSRTLPDGSIVERNAGADLRVEFTTELRGIRLLRGEALFQVAKDPARPFVVNAGAVQVRAVGTAFTVRHDNGSVDVLVTEGRVAIGNEKASADQPVYLDAGARLTVTDPRVPPAASAIQTVSPGQMGTALSWRGKRVEFSNTSLAEAVSLFNRENGLRLSIADRATAAFTINGIFWSDDPEGFVRLLESGFGVKSERDGNTLVLRSLDPKISEKVTAP